MDEQDAGQGDARASSGPRVRRRRGSELESAILDAAWDALGDLGWAGFTVEGVAARAGTGKAAIYRRWPGRRDIAVDVLRKVAPERTVWAEPQVDLRSDLQAFLATGAAFLDGPFGQAVRGVLSEGAPRRILGRDSVLLAPATPQVDAVIGRALRKGELSARPDSAVLNLGQSLLTQEFLFCGTVSQCSLDAIVESVWLPALRSACG